MHHRLLDFLNANGSLFENQYGFRPGRSCEHAILNSQNKFLHSLNKHQISLLLLIDFSKAFDMVDHQILLHKLYHYGVKGTALQWFRSYLHNRQQFVTIDGIDSCILSIWNTAYHKGLFSGHFSLSYTSMIYLEYQLLPILYYMLTIPA